MHNLLHLLNRFNNYWKIYKILVHSKYTLEIPIYPFSKILLEILSSLQQRNIKENPFFSPRE